MTQTCIDRHRHDSARCSVPPALQAAAALIVLGGSWLGASAAYGADDPDFIELTGVVRDFRERTAVGGHPDFERRPTGGFGLYSGNVATYLGADGKPVYTGMGHRITSQWNDARNQPIARHLHNARFESGGHLDPHDRVILRDDRGRDAWEVRLLEASFNPDGTSTWRYRVRELSGGRDLSHWNLRLDRSHQVMPGTTPGYDHGVDGSTGFYGIKWDVTDPFSDGEFTIVLDGHFMGQNHDEGVLTKGGPASPRGRMFVPSAVTSKYTDPFETPGALVADTSLSDRSGSAGQADSGGITSAASFDQWFRDVPGVNLSRPLTLRLNRQPDGTYVFDDRHDPRYRDLGGFFPIEQQLFGNPGGSPDRNFHFTFELHTQFTYDADGQQHFRFIGDDDVWVFIDGKLAIDLGGVHGAMEQSVDLSRFGLEDGETYSLSFFFAERHRTQSNFRIQTNLVLETVGPMTISPVFD